MWLSQAELGTGRVKQGKNTIEAFFDLNANGIWDDGEPYGMVRNVDIGWHRTGEPIPIELSDESRSFTRAYVSAAASAEDAPASDSLTTSVVVRRIAINGKPMQAARTLKTMTVVNDDRAYVTEADVITDDRPDFDWAHLIQDAEAMGIDALVRTQAELSLGTTTEQDDSLRILLTQVLPDLKAGTQNPELYDDVNIWYSDVFDEYLDRYNIKDIEAFVL